jgi:hypothetical protein
VPCPTVVGEHAAIGPEVALGLLLFKTYVYAETLNPSGVWSE